MWALDHKEGRVPKNWCFWTVVLEKTRVPWTAGSNQSILKEIIPEYSLDIDAEAPILWPPDTKSWLIGRDPGAGKDWRQEEKGMTEDKMVEWPPNFNGHEFEQAPGDGKGQGSLACCSPWDCKESDVTEGLNNNRIWSSGIYSRNAKMFQCLQSISLIHHIIKMKDKNHATTSIGAGKAFNKIQQPFMIKILKKWVQKKHALTQLKTL